MSTGMQITLGESGHIALKPMSEVEAPLRQKLPKFRQMGFTSHETYVTWRNAEFARGVWDWARYDTYVDAYRQAGMKWVPFLITGPAYALPGWFYGSAGHTKYRCLEHDQESGIQSLWAPDWPPKVEEFISRFAAQYKDSDIIESILIGVTGNYGEAIYPASGGSEWTSWANGVYHAHSGMWCGDTYAKADFRKWLQEKYPSLAMLNQVWGTQHVNWDSINPIPNEQGTNKRPWLDTVDWYRESMNDWSEFWMEATRKHLPNMPIYLCTGGHAPAEQGCEFGIQTKLAAKHGAGIRITNEGSDYVVNFAYTRWVSSAARFYGTYFGYEPAAGINAKGTIARIYNAICSGADQLHCYDYNFDNAQSIEAWNRYKVLLRKREPKVEVAVWYPNRAVHLRRADVQYRLREMRRVCDYDIVDDQMIQDGALDKYRLLVCISDGPYEEPTLEKISHWLIGERRLYAPNAPGFFIATVDGDQSTDQQWRQNNLIRWINTAANLTDYYPALASALPREGLLVTGLSNVFATEFKDGSTLVLNMNDTSQYVNIRGKTISAPPASIAELKSAITATHVDFGSFE